MYLCKQDLAGIKTLELKSVRAVINAFTTATRDQVLETFQVEFRCM
jgi:hypothetical protein